MSSQKDRKNIIITGFMGTGKTTVGKEVARRLNRNFYDTDQMIESKTKISIPGIFDRFGEAHFRKLERNITRELLTTTKDAVISTGGGTLLSLENRNRFLNSGIVFCLSSRIEVLKKRINDSFSRPLLLRERFEENIKNLLNKRKREYKRLPNQIDTSDLSPEQAAEKIIQTYLKVTQQDLRSIVKIKVEINPASNSYTVAIKTGVIKEVGRFLKKSFSSGKVFVLTNDEVHSLYYKGVKNSLDKFGFDHKVIIIPDGERYKNLKTYNYVFNKLIEHKADRHSVLVTLGGGVICDLGGFVAATYMRGVKLVHIPTTLVAQIDASIGGKVAVDHKMAKNLIGAFYNPRLVLTDPEVLNTLRRKDFLNGLFEAIKIALVCQKELFFFIADKLSGILRKEEYLLRQLIVRCIKEKVRIVQRDPFEKNLRMILNFGHTFAHALETNKKYRSISHGEAVGLGMLLALRLSNKLGHLTEHKTARISELILKLIKSDRLKGVDPGQIWGTIALDKKGKEGKVRFVLLKDIGKPIIEEVNKKVFFEVFEKV
ncbi:MAG: 3-dehydroquinate synthase [Candidatus Zixiibacteriota bacterium]